MSLVSVHDYAIKHKLPIQWVLDIVSPHFNARFTKYSRTEEIDIDRWIRVAEEMSNNPIEKIRALLNDIEEKEFVNTEKLSGEFAGLRSSYEKFKRAQNQNKLLKIAVAGLHSAGKSTFINSLLDQIEQVKEKGPDYKKIISKLAPSGAAPTTRTVTSFVFSKKPYYKDSNSKEYTLEQYRKTAVDQNFRGRFEVGVNNSLLKGVELMDVPGLFADDKDNDVVQSVLDVIDVLFWLIDISDGTIKDSALKGLKAINKPIVIIVTQVQGKDKEGFKKVYANIQAEAERNKLYVSAWNWFSADAPEFLKPSIRDIVVDKKDELKSFIQKIAQESGGAKLQAKVLTESYEESKKTFKEAVCGVKNQLDDGDLETRLEDSKTLVEKDVQNELKSYFNRLLTDVFDYSKVVSDELVKEHLLVRDDYKMTVTSESWDWQKLTEQVKSLDKDVCDILKKYTTQNLAAFTYPVSRLKFHPALWELKNLQVDYSWSLTWGGGYGDACKKMNNRIKRHVDSQLDILSDYMAKPVKDFLKKDCFVSKLVLKLKSDLEMQKKIKKNLDKMIETLDGMEN
ncbi:50S ribosome-binding GTPase [Candidatus Saccharibacteria bacterium]|nr:50S ribosome-binding GTPase [Candidatus Saccharibacteria bacterium]